MTRWRLPELSRTAFIAVYLAPLIAFLMLVSVVPLILAFSDSLKNLSLTAFNNRGEFLGLDNYRQLFGTDDAFYEAIQRTLMFVLVVVPIQFALGLSIAMLLNRDFTGRRLIITMVLIPTMVSPVVVGMMWRFLLMPTFGALTYSLNQMGLFTEVSIFSDRTSALIALMVIDIWQWTPFMMLILLAGLMSVPHEPIEAASLDGANRWQILRHVELPHIVPLVVFALLFRSIEASKVFDTIYVLTNGGPGSATETISLFAYRTNFVKWDLGYGAALCLALAFLSLIVAALFFKFANPKKG